MESLYFQYESPLPSQIADHLAKSLTASSFGWSNPSKWGKENSQARAVLDRARESVASNLGVDSKSLIPSAGTQLIFHWALSGLAKRYLALPEKFTFIHSPIDRQEVHAVADSFFFQGVPIKKLSVDQNGYFDTQVLVNLPDSENAILLWQISNIELGTIQEPNQELKNFLNSPNHHLVIDATGSGNLRKITELGVKWDIALFDSLAWGGPQDVGWMAINDSRSWQNPNPHITPKFSGGGVNPAMQIASALCLENFAHQQIDFEKHLLEMQRYLIKKIGETFPDADLIYGQNPSIVSISFSELNNRAISAERLVNYLQEMGIYVDSGSSCTATICEPSYVLDALDRPNSGNIRINLKFEHQKADIERLMTALQNF